MKVIICLDNNNGLMFNKRRLSSDKAIINDIKALLNNNELIINQYSETLFIDSGINYAIAEIVATNNNYCFVEDELINDLIDSINELVIYYWNRTYPSDQKFNADKLSSFSKVEESEFIGNSHEKITRCIYKR